MKKAIIGLCVTGLMTVFAGRMAADSPLTSTPFYEAYLDVPIIYEAYSERIITKKMMEFLCDSEQKIELKVALVNALGWSVDGKNYAKRFKKYLSQKYQKLQKKVSLSDYTGDELLCLGYMTAMCDYFNPKKALPIVNWR